MGILNPGSMGAKWPVALLILSSAFLGSCKRELTSGGFALLDPSDALEVALPRGEESHVRWELASSECAALEKDGHSDWRLPSVVELDALLGGKSPPLPVAPRDPDWMRGVTWSCNAYQGPEELAGHWYYSEMEEQISFRRLPQRGRFLCVRGRSADCSSFRRLPFILVRVADAEHPYGLPGVTVEAVVRHRGLVSLGPSDQRGAVRVRVSRLGAIERFLACREGVCAGVDATTWDDYEIPIVLPMPLAEEAEVLSSK